MKRSTHSRNPLRKQNLFVTIFLCTASSFFALHKLNYPLIGIDDANIYFVYAKNLANGHGLVYNVGSERVEGVTSLLWTLIAALVFKFSRHPELLLLVVNILLVSLGIAYALRYLQDTFSKQEKNRKAVFFWSALFLALIFTSPRYIVWNTITLMENALWSTLLLITTIFILKDHESSKAINSVFILLSILLLLTRPESMLWVPVFSLVLILRLKFQRNLASGLKWLVPSMISITLAFTVLTAFRLFYFGYPLPNTFYAKVSPALAYDIEQGMIYLIRYFLSDTIAAISIILIMFACLYSVLKPAPRKQGVFLPFLAATGLLVPIFTGGDHFGSFRFYQNTFPITMLSVIYILQEVYSQFLKKAHAFALHSRTRIFLVAGSTLLFAYGFIASQIHAWSRFVSEIETEFRVAEYERRNGTYMEELFAPLPNLPSIGVIASGGIKYTYDGEIIDLLGLNNTIMAHNQGDRRGFKNHSAFEIQTFYELQPDIVWPMNVDDQWKYSETGLKERWENSLGFKGLFNDPKFLELYRYAKVRKITEKDIALVAWFRKDLIQDLLTREEFQVEQYEYSP